MKDHITSLFHIVLVLAGICLGYYALPHSAQSAAPSVMNLPVIQKPAAAITQATLTTLLDCVCAGSIPTLLPDGRVLITFQDHSRGSHVFVAIETATGLQDVPLPPLIQKTLDQAYVSAADSPNSSFQFPGAKQAPGGAVVRPDIAAIEWVVPSRDDDDPTGPTKLKRLLMPLSMLPKP